MTERFIDLHQHLLWGLDDGPGDLEGTYAMLRMADADGVGVIAATPHVMPETKDFNLELYEDRLDQAKAFCAKASIPIQIVSGAEIYYTDLSFRLLREKKVPTIAGTELALIEFPRWVRFDEIKDAAQALLRGGFVPILAHVERYHCLVLNPQRAAALKSMLDIRYQVNCSAVTGRKGMLVSRFCSFLFDREAVDLVATDAHDTHMRGIHMRVAYRMLEDRYGAGYAGALTRFGDGSITKP